jgi:ubiquinone/menaquinone biosynthesis C-methylase UbiE
LHSIPDQRFLREFIKLRKDTLAFERVFRKEAIQKSYGKVARFYDLWSRLTESKAAKSVIELAEVRDGETILEVAIGTGMLFEKIVVQNKSGRNFGIDISPDMLFKAAKRLNKYDKMYVRLQIGNAYHLPFKADTFDLIINNYMLDLLPEQDFVPILSEFKRTLKPWGRIVLSTMAFGEKRYNKMWTWVANQFPKLLTGCRPVSLYEYLEAAGFADMHVKSISQNTFPSEVIRAKNENHPENRLA